MKKRILFNTLCLLTLMTVVSVGLMAILTYSMHRQRVTEATRVEARVFAEMADSEEMETVFGELGDVIRVTIISPDGRVDYDSEADLKAMDNHADRPEIRQAMETGEGWDIRDSQTVDESTYYYAMRMEDGRILRVAQNASSVWYIYRQALPTVLLLLAGMVVLCALAAGRLTEKMLEPIGKMTTQLGSSGETAVYPELEPFISTIGKQNEEILRNANMRVEFTANVSHELKTPLTSISGYAELIESGMAEGEMAGRFAGEIKRSASRLLTLINDTIRLSQMDSPSQEVVMELVDLAQIAGHVVEQLQINAAKMAVKLELDAQEAVIHADRQMMEELVYNLCDNAIRYNVQGGSVWVEVRMERDAARLSVRDTGIGIGEEHRERVFERFYRVDKSRSKATGGTGLGLAIVKHIAARHNAHIGLVSELGVGTTITVTFDRKRDGEREA